MIRCIIQIDHEKAGEMELLPGEHIAGRSHTADIHLSEPDVSGKHLKIEVLPDGVFAENLSSHGTLFRGGSMTERTKLRNGDFLSLGKRLELHFMIPEDQASKPDENATVIPGATPSAETSAEDPGKTVIPGKAPSPEEKKPLTVPPPESVPAPKEDDVMKTDIMHTRLASLEEMNIMRTADKKRSTGRTFKYVLCALAAVAVLVVLYTVKAAPKEENLTWPVDSSGMALGAFTDPGNGGHRNGGFSLAYPAIKGKTEVVHSKDGRILINTRIGKDASVPLRIQFIQKTNPEFLTMDRKAVMARMIADLQKDSRHWNIAQISDVFFIGAENGMPCLNAEFRRESDGSSWFGDLLFFRTGDTGYLRLAETPVSERARAQNFITGTPLVKFSVSYLHAHWEGNPSYKGYDDPAVMMEEISRHLSKQAPFEWARTYLLLQNVLMESVTGKNPSLKRNALNQLKRLRAMQTIWYNSQKIKYNSAKLNNDRRQETAVLELCKTVFSSPDDLRYFTLRRNLWE